MANIKVTPRSLTEAYKRREGDFSPNLVGLQFTDGVSLFTFGNFQITTNLDNKLNKNFVLGGQWSDYYTLDNLNLTETSSQILLSNDIFVKLNFDPYNISRYVYFGSFEEFVRVSLEQIIQKWKGSIYLNPTFNSNALVNTVLSFNYNSGTDIATFLVPKNIITNNFELNVDYNTDFSTPAGEIYNIQKDYDKYVIWTNNGDTEYPIIGYTGSTNTNPYINVQTKGNPFPSLTASTFGQLSYHIKPNKLEVQLFFESLSDFEKLLLNRLTTPIYTSSFDVPKESDGVGYVTTESFTWPVSDGYNLDINTRGYGLYVEKLLKAAVNFDSYKTDLVSRRFVSESIHEFDTNGGTDTTTGDNTYGMKASKLLRIYGREFDEVKKYIDGISFANVVTYDKLDNTSDELIKMMAKNLGFDVLLTVGTDNFNLLEQIQPSLHSPFSGYSRALSSKELDIELWRRLVINAWWLFKSKGTRKVIEFFFSLFKIPECMITLNEYIYLAENRLDPIKIWEQIAKIYGDPDLVTLSDLPMDDYGFPRILTETNTNYFQMNGFWYNGGNDSTTGNNPHIGPYDYGQSYFDQFECFVPDFNNFLTASTQVTVIKNYFNNYNKGTFIFDQNGLPVPYYGTGYANILNNGLVENVTVNSAGLTYVGGNNAPNYGRPSGDTYSMKISFTAGSGKTICDPCAKYQLTYNDDGVVYVIGDPNKPLTDPLCCKNYLLPVVKNAPVCPSPTQLVVTTENIIQYQKGGGVSKECCSKAILGFDVAWDGINCIVPKPCPSPDTLQMSALKDGVILSDGQSLSQNCCTKANLGFDVVWNGKDCVASTKIITKDRFKKIKSTGLVTPNETVLSAKEILQHSTNPRLESQQTKICYWCPPEEYVQTVCSVDAYLATLTTTQITELAVSLGWGNTPRSQSGSLFVTPQNFISNIYTPFFNTYGCLILDNQDNVIRDKACCELRGGVLTNVNGTNYCTKPNPNPCAGSQLNPNSTVWITSTNTLLPQSCCNQNGQYWVSPVSSDNNNITLTSQDTVTTFLDVPGYTATNSYSYCSTCPNTLKESSTVTGIVITDNNNISLSQNCCVRYGFNWDSNTNQCTKCPNVVNYGTNTNPNVITDLNGQDLSEQCCTLKGGFYVNADGKNNKCYICPPLSLYNDLTGIVGNNTNYQIINNEVTYLGSSLTQQCCLNYNSEFGNVSWNSTENKCLVNIPCPPLPALLPLGGSSIQTAPNYSFGGQVGFCGNVTSAWLLYQGLPITDENCCNNIKNDTYNTGVSNYASVSWDPNTNLCRVCVNG